jgi:hypothetical protein
MTSFAPQESRALAIVRVAAPWWAPAWLIARRFAATIPEYAGAPGLEHKAYTLADDGRFGGVYLWASRAAAEAWFDARWHERVRRTRGVAADVRILDAWWTVAGDARPAGRRLPAGGLRAAAAVAWLASTGAPEASSRAHRLEALGALVAGARGLVRASLVAAPDGTLGAVGLFATRADATACWTPARTARAAQALGGAVELTGFAAPVLLDAAAAGRDRPAAAREGAR